MKIINTLLLTGTLLAAAEFTNSEKGNIIGIGFAAAQKINMSNQEAKNSTPEKLKQLCTEEINQNELIKSFKKNKKEAAGKAIEECSENLKRLK